MNEPANIRPNKILCKRCGTVNMKDSKFCHQCGKKLTKPICLHCGKVIPSDNLWDTARFCTECGHRLVSPSGLSGIRKKVIVGISNLEVFLTTIV